MNHYETVFIATPVLSDVQTKELFGKFQGVITENGGQIVSSDEMQDSVLLNRKKAVSAIDKKQSARNASENETIQKIYEEFLGKPGSEKAHELLHTRFHDSSKS